MSVLELREVAGKGRGLFATRPIRAGEVVVQELPFLLYPQQSATSAVCAHCLRLLSCPGNDVEVCMACSSAAFCSPDCAAAAAADPGSHCAAVCAWLRACNMEGLSDEQQSAMQFLFRCASLAAAAAAGAPAAAQHGAQLEALAPGPSGAPVALTLERQELHGRLAHALAAVGAAPLAAGLSAQQVAELLVRDETNAYGIMAAPGPGGERRLRGAGLYATPSLVNHDCMPNVARFDAFDAPGDAPRSNTAVQLRALHDIPAGEEITQSYFPLEWGFHERQDRCQQQYGFACACLRCKEEATWQSDGGDEDAGMADGGACAHGGAPGACQRCCAGGASAQPATAAGDAGAADPAYIGMFISKFVCPAEDCGGTMAPAAPGADVAECNVCGRRRTDADFLAQLEAEDAAEEEDAGGSGGDAPM